MKNFLSACKKILVTAVLPLSLAAPANAVGGGYEALVPLPSVFDFTRGDGWGFALGGSAELGPPYDGSDEYELEFSPAGAMQLRQGNHMLFWEGAEVGWRGLAADDLLLQINARYEGGRETDDSADGYLVGLDETKEEIVGVVEMRQGLSDWRHWVGGRLVAGGSGFGLQSVIAAGHRFGGARDGSGTELFGFITHGNDDFNNRDFGITAAEATAATDAGNDTLTETALGGGIRSFGLTLLHRHYISEHLHFIAEAGAEFYSDDIAASPIARNSQELEATLTFLYHF